MNLYVNKKMRKLESFLLSKKYILSNWHSLESLFFYNEELQEDNDIKGFLWNFVELRALIVQQYWDNKFYFSVSLIDDILFQVLKNYNVDVISEVEKVIQSTKLLSSTGIIIFPLHSLGLVNEGARLFFNKSRTVFYYNSYYKSCFFPQSNSEKQTEKNLITSLKKFKLTSKLNSENFYHKMKSRNIDWLFKNPIMIVPFDSYSSSYYDTQRFVNKKIFFTTLSLLFYSVIQDHKKKVERKIFSTSNTNNFETLDIKHYMLVQNIIYENNDNIQAIPLHGDQFDIYEEMDLNVELDLTVKLSQKKLKKINSSLVDFETKYMKYCFFKRKVLPQNYRFYSRIYDSLKMFKLSFSGKNRGFFNTVNLAMAFEILLTDYYAIGVFDRVVSRAEKSLKYTKDKKTYMNDLKELLKNRGQYVHNGKLDISSMDISKVVRLRYAYVLLFSNIMDSNFIFTKNDHNLIGKILD
jgi:hypothetical protein